jgi:DNA-binding transcriptional regulator GbsR (MarR family)
MNQDWESKMNELRDAQLVTQHLLGALAERHDREIGELREAQLVTQRLIEGNERNWNRRFEQMFERLEQLVEAQQAIIEAQQATQATVDSLVVAISRFIQGRGGDGH